MVKTLQLKLVLLLCMIMGAGTAWATDVTGKIQFGTPNVKINQASVTADDDKGNSWTITTVGTTSFTPQQAYSQVGSSSKPATSITFTMTLSDDVNIKNINTKFGGFSGTAGTVTIKVDDTTVGTGSLNATEDVYINSSSAQEGNTITVTVTDIAKGVKCYWIEYVYETSGGTNPTTYTVTFDAGAGTFVGNTDFPNASNTVAAGTYTLPSATPASGYTFDGWLLTGSTTPITGNYTVSGDVDFTASYSQTGGGTTGSEQWVLTNLADLTSTDVFVIVGNNGSNYAMTNDNGTGSAPAASAVTVENDAITSTVAANIQWNISGDATNGYTFYPNGSTTTWLYCTNANNGLRVGDSSNNTFVINSNYLYNSGQSRYIGVYNSSDWRSYTSINNNIKDQTFAFYKKVAGDVTSPSISANNVNITYDATGGSIGYTLTNEVTGGVLTASTTASWLTLGTVGTSSVPFTCSANDGEERTATVTLTYTYNTNETVTKTVTVTQAGNPNGPGTENNPYTVAQARAAIDAQSTISNAYVTGIISQVDSYSDTYKSITYWISDDGTTTNQLEVYSGKGLDGADFSSVDDVVVGATVTVKGTLKKYNTTYEFDKSNELVSYTAPTNPYITADDVNITYDATGGNIAFTVNNPATGGYVSASTTDTWITLGNETTSPISFTCAANTGAERTATVTLTYTYGNSQTVTKDVTVTQAANSNVIMTIAEARAQNTGSVTTKGVVTSLSSNSKTAYIQDNTAAIVVFNSSAALSASVGDEIKVEGTLSTYNGLLEITSPTVTVLSQNNSVTPEVMTIAQVNASTKQGWLVKIEDATVTAISGQNVTIAQNSDEVVVRFNATPSGFAVNDEITLTGNIGCFNTVQIANPTDVSVAQSTTSSITPSTTTINVTAAETEDNITVTYNNINVSTVDVKFFSDAAGTTEINGFNWMDAEITGTNNGLHYMIDENTSTEARTAYLRIYALDADDNDVYSDVITITQAGYVADYATLPFYYNGGRADIENTNGLTHSGLGTDYNSSSNPNTLLKFDSTDDVLILKMNSDPITLSFNIKGNGFSGGTFTVSTSANGTDYTALDTYTDLGAEETMSYNLNSSVRYIKWTYTNKASGNVGLGKIRVNCEVVTIKAGRQYTGFSCDKALDFEGTGLTAQIVTSATGTTSDVTKVPANTGIIVGLDAVTTTQQEITVPVYTGTATDDVTGNMLVAVLTATTIPQTENGKTNYVFGKGTINNVSKEQFFKVRTGGMEVPANNVYLAVPTNAAKDLDVIGFGGDATSINALEAETVNGNIYNLQGQKVNRAQKGIYIVNGRKVVIK